MSSRRSTDPRVFFPWEQRGGVMGALGRRRVLSVIVTATAALAIVAIYENEERSASIRATRASLTTVARALSAYRADHGGGCPRGLGDLVATGYLQHDPVDAWGRQLRLECPGRRDPTRFDLTSDGPDGLPGGLDRIQ